jgi:hypothetical protein
VGQSQPKEWTGSSTYIYFLARVFNI